MDNIYHNDCFYSDYYPLNNQNLISTSNYMPHYRSGSSSYDSLSSSMSGSYREDTFYSPNEGFAKGNMQANIYKPYKIKNPGLPMAQNDRERMLLDVQKYSFAMWDLNLYLNTHPTDREVMRLYDQYRTAYNKARNDYENKYGSLSVCGTNTNSASWEWNNSPWPWEV